MSQHCTNFSLSSSPLLSSRDHDTLHVFLPFGRAGGEEGGGGREKEGEGGEVYRRPERLLVILEMA